MRCKCCSLKSLIGGIYYIVEENRKMADIKREYTHAADTFSVKLSE